MSRINLFLTAIGLTIICSAFNLQAQKNVGLTNSEINGKVQRLSTHNPLYLAQVVLYSESSELVKVTATDKNGKFCLKNLPSGKYYIQVSYLGYQSKIIDEIEVNSYKTSVNTKSILLKNTRYQIKEVIVKAPKKEVQYLSDLK